MKKIFLSALILVPSITFGQVAWSTAGNALGSGGVLGTTSAQPVSIRTNSTERIGIGSSGTITFTGLTGSGSGLMQLSSTGVASRLNYPGDAFQLLNGNGSWTNYSTLSGWNLASGIIYTTQKLGIGVTSPSQALEISGNVIASGSISASSFDIGGIATVQGHLNISNSVIHHAYDATAGTRNEVYTTDHEYYINSNTSYNYNTILNNGNTGKTGIGTNSPTDKLHIYGSARIQGMLKADSVVVGDSAYIKSKSIGGIRSLTIGNTVGATFNPFSSCINKGGVHINTLLNGFYESHATDASSNSGSLVMGHNGTRAMIESNGSGVTASTLFLNYYCGNNVEICRGSNGGNVFMTDSTTSNGVGIATKHIPNGYKLAVNGKIIAKELVLQLRADWPDYVFESNYQRKNYLEKENYLLANKHLENIAPAKEMQQNGVPVESTLSGLVQNTEENTLDIIDIYKTLAELKVENQKLKAEIEDMKQKGNGKKRKTH